MNKSNFPLDVVKPIFSLILRENNKLNNFFLQQSTYDVKNLEKRDKQVKIGYE